MSKKSPTNIGISHKRMRMMLAFSLIALLVIGGRLFVVQSLNASAVAATASENRTRQQVTTPKRGQIVDASGRILATSVDRYDLVIDQRKVEPERKIGRKKLD